MRVGEGMEGRCVGGREGGMEGDGREGTLLLCTDMRKVNMHMSRYMYAITYTHHSHGKISHIAMGMTLPK